MGEVEVKTLYSKYLGIKAACRYTGLSRRTLDYAKANGELPFIKKGRKILFRVGDLNTWMESDRIDVSRAVKYLEGKNI